MFKGLGLWVPDVILAVFLETCDKQTSTFRTFVAQVTTDI